MVPPECCCAVGVRTTEQADAELAGGQKRRAFGYVLSNLYPESCCLFLFHYCPGHILTKTREMARANTRGLDGDLEAQIEAQKRAQRRQKRGGKEATVDRGNIGTCFATYLQWTFRCLNRYISTLLQWWNYTDCITVRNINISNIHKR